MWDYEKRLQYPVNIKTPNAKLAQYIISQYGGPDGELGASMRYLSQRFATPYREVSGLLTDIGTEELGSICWKSIIFYNKIATYITLCLVILYIALYIKVCYYILVRRYYT